MKHLKMFATTIVLTVLLVAIGCDRTDFDKVLSTHENQEARLKALEDLTINVNEEIKTIKNLIDALQKKVAVNSYKPLADGSGYELAMSDGTKITLKNGKNGKNGKDGTTPLVNVKKHTDGNLYWTINNAWMLDADGNKVLAVGKNGIDGKDGADGTNGKDGKDGTDGADGTNGKDGQDGTDGKDAVAPGLRINGDSHWEISTDGGKTWQLMLGSDGNPVVAKGKDGKDGQDGADGTNGKDGKDGNANFQITETTAVIIIIYNGTTYTIPKVRVMVTGVELDKTSLTTIIGTTTLLQATVVPANAAYKAVTWSSSDESVASVDDKGNVSATTKGGVCTITVATKDGNFKANCTVTVKELPWIQVTTELEIGESMRFDVGKPKDIDNCWVDWNNNGKKDPGEERFYDNMSNYFARGICKSKTFKIYGVYEDFSFSNINHPKTGGEIPNKIIRVEASENNPLKRLVGRDNDVLREIDLKNFENLESLELYYANHQTIKTVYDPNYQLHIKNLAACKKLSYLDLTDCALKEHSLDITSLTALKFLYLEFIYPDFSIDFTKNINLEVVKIRNGVIKQNVGILQNDCFFDFSNCTKLRKLYLLFVIFSYNRGVDILKTLPNIPTGEETIFYTYLYDEYTELPQKYAKILTDKGWKIEARH